MARPVRADSIDLSAIRLVPRLVSAASLCVCTHLRLGRFSVAQGVKSDGSVKIRAVDNFSWSSKGTSGRKRKRADVSLFLFRVASLPDCILVFQIKAASINGHFDIDCNIQHDHLDDLLEAMRLHHSLIEEA